MAMYMSIELVFEKGKCHHQTGCHLNHGSATRSPLASVRNPSNPLHTFAVIQAGNLLPFIALLAQSHLFASKCLNLHVNLPSAPRSKAIAARQKSLLLLKVNRKLLKVVE